MKPTLRLLDAHGPTGVSRPRGLGALVVLVLLAALGALLVDEARTPTTSGGGGGQAISVSDTGAGADDDRDDLAAFAEAVDRARVEGRVVEVPPGTFHLSDVLVVDGVTLRGAGADRTTLVSPDTTAGSIDLTGEAPSLAGLTHVVPEVEDRSPEPGRQNVNVMEATSFEIADVHLDGARGAGVLIRQSHGGVVRDSRVEGTLADGVHMTSGSTGVVVRDNVIRDTGDDGIAVVSYLDDGDVSRDVLIRGNRVEQGRSRGITVVGGESVTIADNLVDETANAGIYVAAEEEWDTYGVREVRVSENRVVDAPTDSPGEHASVLVYSSGELIDDVWFSRNTVVGSTTTGFGSWTAPGEVGDIGDLYFTDNVVEESAESLRSPTRFLAGSIFDSPPEGS